MIKLTPKELLRAAKWAEEHNYNVHKDSLEYADFTIRHLGGGGIGLRTVITCEACDRIKVHNENDHDVTDYEAW